MKEWKLLLNHFENISKKLTEMDGCFSVSFDNLSYWLVFVHVVFKVYN